MFVLLLGRYEGERSPYEHAKANASGRPNICLGEDAGFTALRGIDVPMKTGTGLMRGNIRLQAGSGLKPVVEVVTGRTGALLIKVICVIANFFVAGLRTNGGAGGCIFHKIFNFKCEENYPSASPSLRASIG